jgi:hypothetical protein
MVCITIGLALTTWSCRETDMSTEPIQFAKGGIPGPPGGESLGNNLSFPVVFSDGFTKPLRGEYGSPQFFDADLWYVWSDGNCKFITVDPDLTCPAELPPDATAVYQQQGESNWQAESVTLTPAPGSELYVDWIDWGDNLEAVAWYLNSKVRTEVVLIQDLVAPMTAFEMVWLSGLGMNELWGTNTATLDNAQATVYTHCARLYIQRLFIDREDITEGALTWVAGTGWTETVPPPEGDDLIGEAFVDKPVWLGGDGPGYYSAEINVKGKVIYGYNWDVNKENEGEGDYRITFAVDGEYCTATLNTFFDMNTTIVVPEEESAVIEEEPVGEGGITGIDYTNNLTYIDVMIKGRKGGGKGGKGGKGG